MFDFSIAFPNVLFRSQSERRGGCGSARGSRAGDFLRSRGVTLVEMLVALAVLMILMVLLAQVTGSATDLWRKSSSKAQKFREARRAMETIQRTLSQATLNTYYEYLDGSGNPRTTNNAATFVPSKYGRMSELRFVCGPVGAAPIGTIVSADGGTPVTQAMFFHAPTGEVGDPGLRPLNSLLNTYGFYVEVNSDSGTKPVFAGQPRQRFRLMQMIEQGENLTVYTHTSGDANSTATDWYGTPLAKPEDNICLAENIVALLLRARYPGETQADAFAYSSMNPGVQRHQLPPVVDVTLVAIDEASAARLAAETSNSSSAMIAKLGLGGAFSDPLQFDNDLKALEEKLVENHLAYRVFTSSVSIEGAKWSTQ